MLKKLPDFGTWHVFCVVADEPFQFENVIGTKFIPT